MTYLIINILGLFSSVCFFFSGWPVAWAAYRDGKTSLPASTCWAVFLGAVSMYAYLFITKGFDPIVALDYGSTIFCWGLALRYLYKPVERKTDWYIGWQEWNKKYNNERNHYEKT